MQPAKYYAAFCKELRMCYIPQLHILLVSCDYNTACNYSNTVLEEFAKAGVSLQRNMTKEEADKECRELFGKKELITLTITIDAKGVK